MRVLLVKTSSMGDVVHTFPAVTEALAARPDLEIDWLVEEGFADIARLHPGVKTVITVAVRRWRKAVSSAATWAEISALKARLRDRRYDLVLDAQGLAKSAVLAKLAGVRIEGLDRASLREPLARLFYARGHNVPRDLHAIERTRRLFGAVFGYTPDLARLDYGLRAARKSQPSVMLLHGTSWASKRWPAADWGRLAGLVAERGLTPVLTFASADEEAVAREVARFEARTRVIPKSRLSEIAAAIASSRAVVGTDTGLTHLAAAYDRPTVAIFLSTAPGLTGPKGRAIDVLAPTLDCAPCRRPECPKVAKGEVAPCVATVSPERVIAALDRLIADVSSGGRS